MLQKLRDNLFWIGTALYALAQFAERLFPRDTIVMSFIQGFACGILIMGLFRELIKNKKAK